MRAKFTLDKKARKLGEGFSAKDRRRALTKTLFYIRNDLEVYPKLSGANRGPTPFYIRGRGMQVSPSRNLNNSERLSVRWRQKINASGKSGTITNSASYSDYVIGGKQAKFHKKRGWVSVPRYIKNKKNQKRMAQDYLDSLLEDV